MIENKGLAHLHSIAAPFLGGVLGFGFAKLLIPGVHGTAVGIALAGLSYSFLSKAIDQVLTRSSIEEQEWFDPLVLWFATLIVSVVLLVPASAFIAPNYDVQGVLGNVVTIVLVYVADTLVSRASPWGGVPPEVLEEIRSSIKDDKTV